MGVFRNAVMQTGLEARDDAQSEEERGILSALRQYDALVPPRDEAAELTIDLAQLLRARELLDEVRRYCLARLKASGLRSDEKQRIANLLLEVVHQLNRLEPQLRRQSAR